MMVMLLTLMMMVVANMMVMVVAVMMMVMAMMMTIPVAESLSPALTMARVNFHTESEALEQII